MEERTYLELAEEYTDSWFEGTDCESTSIALTVIEDRLEHTFRDDCY